MPGWRYDGYRNETLEANVALDLLPETRLPSINVELIIAECCYRHGRIGRNRFICSNIFGTQFERSSLTIACVCESVNCETWARQNLVVDNVVEKYGIRIEGFLRQDYAFVE